MNLRPVRCLLLAAALGALLPAQAHHRPGHDDAKAEPAAAAAAGRGWTLAADDARLSFVSIKNDQVAEVHRFGNLGGAVDANGALSLTIPLDAVETGIPIRNERLRTLLFDTASHPLATVQAQVDAAALRALRVGSSVVIDTPVSLTVRGQRGELPGSFRVTRVAATQWRVSTEAPLLVNAAAFGLGDGIEALREIAKLQAIAAAVPVTASLRFDSAGR